MANPELTHKPSSFDKKARALIQAASSSSPERTSATRKLACGLGWFSIGLGLAELLAPRQVARLVGLKGQEPLLRAYGMREIASGIGILTSGDSKATSAWVWSRVAGDALDLSTLGAAVANPKPRSGNPVAGIIAVAGVTMLDIACATTLQAEEHAAAQTHDYSDRVGLRSSPEEMRGAALDTFTQPPDMRASPEVRAAVH